MAETLLQFQTPVAAPDGTLYRARACGAGREGGSWEGWIEFDPIDPSRSETLRTARETTQPNRKDAVYWATGLTPVFLEGALHRALNPLVVTAAQPVEPPVFDGPARLAGASRPAEHAGTPAILDPFSVYEKGEVLLRRQLSAMSAWHLVNIIVEYQLSDEDRAFLNRRPAAWLVDLIVAEVQARVANRA
jgi:hypothetical protein